jgi:hypothetical protein
MLNFNRGENEHMGKIRSDSADDQPNSTAGPGPSTSKKKPVSERRLEANRRNAQRSTGPRNTERTRLNATRHALRAQGLTPWDDAEEYGKTIESLQTKYPSSNPIDIFLMEQSALEMMRARRIAALEADNVVALSSAPERRDEGPEGIPTINFAPMKDYAIPVFDLMARYTTATMNRLLRYRRELERIPQAEPKASDTK